MNPLLAKISKEDLLNLPLKSFEGKIEVICTEVEFQKHLAQLRGEKVLGFDTETRPAFKKGVRYKVALLQLSGKNTAYIFRLNMLGFPKELSEILASEQVVKAGAAIRDDIKGLQKYRQFTPGGFVELQTYVTQFGIEDAALAKITGNVLGFRISKSQRLTNWETPELSSSQLKYAATDAWVGYKIYTCLENEHKPNLS